MTTENSAFLALKFTLQQELCCFVWLGLGQDLPLSRNPLPLAYHHQMVVLPQVQISTPLVLSQHLTSFLSRQLSEKSR